MATPRAPALQVIHRGKDPARSMLPFLLGIVLFVVMFTQTANARLVLNEALANEPGSATSAEWVEVVNWPDSGGAAINLSGYLFVDGRDTTVFDTNLVVAPGGYVILARKTIGERSFETFWGDASGTWGDNEAENYPVIAAAMSLRNSADTVTLIGSSGDTSTILWTRSSEDGVSLERIRPDRGDGADNFAPCVDPLHSTPGRANSVLPVHNDLAIVELVVPQEPRWGETLTFQIMIENVGLGRSVGADVVLLEDVAPFTPEFEPTRVAAGDVPALDEGDQVSVSIDWTGAPPGWHRMRAAVLINADTVTVSTTASMTVRHSQPLVIISEYLANPTVNGPDEWVEISNRSDFPINMVLTRIGDSTSPSGVISPLIGNMPPGAFWVLAESETAFRAFYPGFDGTLFQVPGWRTLNNTGDAIRLYGAAGEIIDSLTFRDLFDNNRSVERLDLLPSFAGPDDWTGSIDPSGATPGRANSVSRASAGGFDVDIEPNPIHLSRAQVARIAYRMEIGENLTLKVFDRTGRLVRTIADRIPAATGTATWDGTDDSGDAVHPGPYILLARSDPAGAMRKLVVVVAP